MKKAYDTAVNADNTFVPTGDAASSARDSATIAAIEYETLAFSRHVATAVGRTRQDEPLLDGSAYTLLNLIASGGPASIGDLSGITGLDASTLNRQTAALIERGLVLRTGDPKGGIARVFVMTGEGSRVLAAEQLHSHTALARTLSEWGESEREELRRVLRSFNESIERNYSRPWPRADQAES